MATQGGPHARKMPPKLKYCVECHLEKPMSDFKVVSSWVMDVCAECEAGFMKRLGEKA